MPGTADAKVPSRAAGIGRLGTAAAWISAACCLPYLVLKVVWTAGLPVGITDRSVLHSHGWAAANALMAAIELAGLLLVLALTRPWARRWPTWLLLFPVWVGTGLLFRVVVGTALMALFARPSQASGGSLGGFQPWVFVMVYVSFAGQGAALGIAFACYVRARWGRLLGERTGEVVARRAARVRSWPEDHLAEMAEAVAGLAVAVAAVFCYWAADGSFGLSAAQPHPSWALQASRAAGPVIAVAGLLGLAGRWGHQTRFWLPVALAWVGSGSLAAFDGLELLLNLLMSGTGASGSGWSLAGTVLVIEVVIGVSCAAVGALALTAAAKDDRPAGWQGLRRTGPVTGPTAGGAPEEDAMSRLRKMVRIPGRELDPVGGRGRLGAHARHLVPAVSKSEGHGGGDTAMQKKLLEGRRQADPAGSPRPAPQTYA